MARMVPPHLSTDVKSSGERRIFSLFENDPDSRDWVVLHSLGLARHIKRQYGEIDFVVLAPGEGIFCLEVKSGRVGRRDGVWTFTNRFGVVDTRTVGPFMQAREGMFSLLEAVRSRFGFDHRLAHLVYRYGVMLPDIQFDDADPEHEPWEVYDFLDRRRPISAYVKRLSRMAHKQVRNTRWYVASESRPTRKDVEQLVAFLRGDFEGAVPSTAMINDAEHELLRLTEEQYHSLDAMEDNSRCLFDGGAGTGKTLIAVEQARRELARGKRVLLLCFNRLLGVRLAEELTACAGGGSLTVTSFHRYLRRLIERCSCAEEFRARYKPDDNEFYRVDYPLYALAAIQEGGVEPFDALIIDEGQDLIRTEYLDVFDALLAGGLNGGRWAIFCDLRRQAIYADLTSEAMLALLDERVSRYARFRLTVNCRNTRPIGEETARLSGFDLPPFLPANVTGPPVDYSFYSDTESERARLRQVLDRLLGEGIRPGRITILAPVRRADSCLALPLEGLASRIEEVSETALPDSRDTAVRFATVQSFKGLENSVVILVDVKSLSTEQSQALLYVGMSRARHRLYVLLSEAARKDYLTALERQVKRSGAL